MAKKALGRNLEKDYHWPGNVRELEQAVRRILITHHYEGDSKTSNSDLLEQLTRGIDNGTLGAEEIVRSYCYLLYKKYNTYEEVARRTALDRRTVKKHIISKLVKNG